jgi:polar amino acid transport system substrate-binding protein
MTLGISNIFKSMAVAVGVTAAAFLASTTAQASTLADIISRGSVKIGVLTGAPPMGMVDEKGNPTGYDVDVANLVGEYLNLPVELVPLTPPSRIPALQTGKVDFLVATLASTGERAKAVMFTQPYSAFNMDIISGPDAKFSSLDDLKGKSVSVNRGSTQETALRKANVEGLNSTAAQALLSNQVDAVALPSTVGEAIIKQRADAGLQVGFTFFRQGNSMTTRMGDFEMHQWLNNAVYLMKLSGDLDRISEKWTGRPFPDLPSF